MSKDSPRDKKLNRVAEQQRKGEISYKEAGDKLGVGRIQAYRLIKDHQKKSD